MQGWHYGKGLFDYKPIFRLTKLAFLRASFVLFYTLPDVGLQHLFNERSGKRNQSVKFTRYVDLCIQTVFHVYSAVCNRWFFSHKIAIIMALLILAPRIS